MRNKVILTVAGALVLALGLNARSGVQHLAQDSSQDKDSVAKADLPLHESSVVDEVIWVVGDEAILKSDVEVMRLQAEAEGVRFPGDPDCAIPEQIALQKLYLHQAAIDSIEVTESEVNQSVDQEVIIIHQLRNV